ncbi:hypothetical protein FRB97_008852 [Tulasnella sp. 331]|nr:hypothetical protein FRB97_008852 [Tulasnella sp. 331]
MPPQSSRNTSTAPKKRSIHVTTAFKVVLNTAIVHQTLDVPELLLKVLSHMGPRELLSAARVCKMWSPWVVEVLWGQSEVPLSAILDKLSWLNVRNGTDTYYLTIDLPVLPNIKQWNIFLRRFPHKVTRLYQDILVVEEAIDHLMKVFKATGTVLFPRLQTLRVSLEHFEGSRFPTISLLKGSPLRNVVFGDCCCSNDLDFLPDALLRISSSIEHLTLSRLSPMYMDPDLCTVALSNFVELRTAHLHDISLETWSSLASCLLLRWVTVTETSEYQEPEVSNYYIETKKGSVDQFPSLQSLSIDSLSTCSAILFTTDMPDLRKLEAGVVMDEQGQICRTLVERSQHLEEIKLNLEARSLNSKTMRTFATLPELRQLSLGGDVLLLGITDSDILFIARSLPSLQVLSIDMVIDKYGNVGSDGFCRCRPADDDDCEANIHQLTSLTGDSLLSVMENCRDLIHLALPLDLCNFGSNPSSNAHSEIDILLPPPSRSLKTLKLRLGDDRPMDILSIASLLVKCFPEVTKFQTCGYDCVDTVALTDKTQPLMKEFKRQQELITHPAS